MEVTVNNVRLMRAFAPRRFDGEALFFQAAREELNAAEAAGLWRPHVASLEHHLVDATHAEMTGPEALRLIGPVIADRLAGRPAVRNGPADDGADNLDHLPCRGLVLTA
jgi:thioesterase domain-containing protein